MDKSPKILAIAFSIVSILLGTGHDIHSSDVHRQISFEHLTPVEGLSQVSVNDIYVDEFGVVWIGTRDGLNRYDGQSIQVFRLEKDNPNSLFCNTVLRISGDGHGRLFLACSEGLAEYDMRTDCFRVLHNDSVSALCFNGGLYAASGRDILKFSEDGTPCKVCELNGNAAITAISINGDEALVGTEGSGLWKMNLSDGTQSVIIPSCNVTGLFTDSANSLWAGTWSSGLYCIRQDGSTVHYTHSDSDGTSISSDFTRCCCEDENGAIWVGTFSGLDRLDKGSDAFSHFGTADGMTHASVWCIRKDNQGTLWIGTYFGGVNYFNPEFEIYHRYSSATEHGRGLSASVVGRIIEDKDANLWIATEGGGVNHFNRKTGAFRWYSDSNGGKLSARNIKALYYDEKKEILWIGTHLGGLDRLDIRTGKVDVFMSRSDDPETLPSNIIRDIIPYGESLIVATQNGVCLFRQDDGRCTRLFQTDKGGELIRMVDDIELDSHGRLWIAANGEGVFRYDFAAGRLVHFNTRNSALSNNTVNNIFEDHLGRIWFSTAGSGIDVFSQETETFHNYDISKSGYLSGCVYQAVEDIQSNEILLITDNGFCLLDPTSGSSRHFNRENGFPLSSINENALCLTNDGEIFLGGQDGMISFKKSLLSSFPEKGYQIIPSKLFVNGDDVNCRNSKYLSESLPYCRQLTFDHTVSLFTIEFSTTNYIASNRDEIIYKLDGFSDVWNSCRGQNSITYSNLSAGRYLLIIKPANDSQSICEPYEIAIRVRPPWYATAMAYVIYFLLGAGLIYLSLRSYNSRVNLQQSLIYEQKHRSDIEELNQAKLRFFTDISHEIRTPLTIMIAQLEAMMKHQWHSPGEYNKVLSVYKNCFQLKELVGELLEFRKQEQGELRISASCNNLVKLAKEYYLVYEEYAKSKGIDLQFEKETDHLEVWYDRRQMQKVVSNLLSNAFKYTQSGGSITIYVRQEGNVAVLGIRDTGCGIPESELSDIFKRFHRVEGTEASLKEGTGIGLALSKGIIEGHHGSIEVESTPGKGSEFIVKLPLGYSHFNENQIVDIHESSADPQQALAPSLVQAKPSSGGALPTMLVVDDNESIRKLLVDIMSTYYRVLSASNGEEALETIKNDPPDIVISDVLMPRMSGIELCGRIKSDVNTCHIPVILLTAQVAVEQNLEGFLKGADDYISKPFNSELLISRCNNLVNSRIVMQEKFSKQPQASAMMLASNPIDKEILDRAMKIIEANLENNDFNINAFAKEMAMSRTVLFSKIKAITGQTPNELIVTIRLKKGAWMLRNQPELSISEIAERTGFSTAKYFSKCFMDVYHIRPFNYRKGINSSEL